MAKAPVRCFLPQKYHMQIRNLIFDLGNVLLDIDLPAIPKGFQALFGADYEAVMQQLQAQRIFQLYETGGISTDEFVDNIRLAGPTPLSAESVIDVWNSIFIGVPPERFAMLERLRDRYGIFLLSNINELHADWIDAYMLREHGIAHFQSQYFDGAYYSHLIRLRKPDAASYEYVLADAELKAHECLFIDDLAENIAGAEAVGIQGLWHPLGSDIVERMREF
jgi:glucose-1-phosphatase